MPLWDPQKLDSILLSGAQTTVVVVCHSSQAAKKLRWALAHRRGPAGSVVLRVKGRRVIAEPKVDPIISVTVS